MYNVKNIISFFLISICFVGCYDRNTHRDKDLEQSLIEANNFDLKYYDMFLFKLKRNMMDDEKKNKPYYDLVYKLHTHSDSLIKDLNKFYKDSLPNGTIDNLISRYKYITEILKRGLSPHNPNYTGYVYPIIQKDFSMMKVSQRDKLIALEMVGNIEQNETNADLEIIRNVRGSSFSFDVYHQKFNDIENTNGHSYSLGLQSETYLQSNITAVYLDTIYRDGKVIPKYYNSKLNNYFAVINFDSLSKGTYTIKGSLERKDVTEQWRYDTFSHTFEIKK